MRVKTILIGLGKIGFSYDISSLYPNIQLTHSSAIFYHGFFELVAAIDPDEVARTSFQQKYKINTYPTILDCPERKDAELIVIATPLETRDEIYDQVLPLENLRVLLVEKPLASNAEDCSELKIRIKNSGKTLFTNYFRGSDPEIALLKNALNAKPILPTSGLVQYQGSLINNGSHFIHLMLHLFGPVLSAERLVTIGGNETALDTFLLIFKNARINFIQMPSDLPLRLEVELVNNAGLFRIDGSSLEVFKRNAQKSTLYEDDTIFGTEFKLTTESKTRPQMEVYNQLENYLNGDPHHLCSINDAIEVLKIVDHLERQDNAKK